MPNRQSKHDTLVSGIKVRAVPEGKESDPDFSPVHTIGTLTGLATRLSSAGETKVLVTNWHVLSGRHDGNADSNTEMYQHIRGVRNKVGTFLRQVKLAKGEERNKVDAGICTFAPDDSRPISYALHEHRSASVHQKDGCIVKGL